jgi:trehalose 6-phosphate synthase
VTIESFPIGIIPENFRRTADSTAQKSLSDEVDGLLTSLRSQNLILGVDRLDYTKGIPERIAAYGELLRRYPQWRRRTALVQISVPSRADVPEYEEQRSRIEEIVGRVNGEFGEADWVPIRYLYRSYGHDILQQLYRVADVGYVTPLRDGMNLVAKEFVAAQDPGRPGVLLLSKFAGAAEELEGALLTNPWHREGMAEDLNHALTMTLEDRQSRYKKLIARVTETTARTWAEKFLSVLATYGGTGQ